MDKPLQILELEKAYNVVISKKDYSLNKYEPRPLENYFVVNDEYKITNLSINNSHIADLSEINIIEGLEYLCLSRNNIKDIGALHPQKNLKHLFLGGNNLKDIDCLCNFPNLIELAIWDNPIAYVDSIKQLHHLRYLYCQDINLKCIEFLQNLPDLIQLYASSNKIFDISVLSGLTNLEELLLDNNKIEDISPLETLNQLRRLDLRSNSIRKVPMIIADRLSWSTSRLSWSNSEEEEEYIYDDKEGFYVSNNPLEFPPVSVIELGQETVKNYYATAARFGHAPLSEGRIIVIGDGSAGKSSLIERVLYNSFEQGKSQTNGIRIEKWKIQHRDGRELLFHMWDFGGQEIQHAVHKFFFTEGCIYILVLDNRKEEEPEYWLQQIESLGRSAPVLVVFNKQDDNANEIADRKFLKEKYPNIVGFYNTSCKTGFGISDFKNDLELQVVQLKTVNEQFPNNWFRIKKSLEEHTTGEHHYLTYDAYQSICRKNNVESEKTRKLLLKYFTTIGAITWFGDTYLNFLHVLSPAWITQGVYKIITSQKTAQLLGKIDIDDFEELLQPTSDKDYTYEQNHYGYILSMMKKFDLCYTPDDKSLLIPSAFGKVPKVEYKEFRGNGVRNYILQFKDYMPLALIHRFTAKKLPEAFDNNYWYSGIVIQDSKSSSLAMVQADKEAKRIYVRIKGEVQLGIWEHIRRELYIIASSYANITYSELVALDEKAESVVDYQDLISHIQARKEVYFHPKLQQDFNVGYLIGLFESKESTLSKFRKGELLVRDQESRRRTKVPAFVVNILNNNSPTIETNVNTQVTIALDIQIINNLSSNLIGESNYLIEELDESNKNLREALQKVIQFAEDAKSARNANEVKEKGWGRRLKNVLEVLGNSGEQIKKITEGGEAMKSVLEGIKNLALQLDLKNIKDIVENIL